MLSWVSSHKNKLKKIERPLLKKMTGAFLLINQHLAGQILSGIYPFTVL